jgi:hypothetical protein
VEGSFVGLFRGVDLRLGLLEPTVFVFGGRRVGLVVTIFVRVIAREEFVDVWESFRRLVGDGCLSLDAGVWMRGLFGRLIASWCAWKWVRRVMGYGYRIVGWLYFDVC